MIEKDTFGRAQRTPIDRMEALGRAGFTVSVVYGPTGRLVQWSVDVLSPKGESFAMPFAARSFSHAIDIAEQEIERRGWLTAGDDSRD